MSRGMVLWIVMLSAVACGGAGSGDPDEAAGSPPSESPSPRAEKVDRSASAVDAAGDLSDFVCELDPRGRWSASGVVTNSTRRAADYRVTVVVSDGPGVSIPGVRRTLTDLAPATPESFTITDLPSTDTADPTCHVELLRLP